MKPPSWAAFTSAPAAMSRLTLSTSPAATAEWIVFLDDDVVPAPGWGEALAFDLARTGPAAVQGAIEDAVAGGCSELDAVKCATSAGTGCGGCVPQVTALMNDALRRSGREVSTDLCSHFAHTRADLFDLVRINGHRTVESCTP